MRYILCFAPLLILLICGSACTSMETPTPTPTPIPPPISTDLKELKAQIGETMNARLKVAQYELQLYEEELKATKEEIRQAEARKGPSPSLLAWENELKGKVIQTKVKIRELETAPNEQH